MGFGGIRDTVRHLEEWDSVPTIPRGTKRPTVFPVAFAHMRTGLSLLFSGKHQYFFSSTFILLMFLYGIGTM